MKADVVPEIIRTNLNLPDRKRNRIHGWDYSENGYYFVTICLDDMFVNRFGEVKNGKMILNEAGKMVEENLLKLPKLFSIGIDIYQIMPNHIHVIFTIENYGRSKNMGQTWKSVPTTNKIVGGDFYIAPKRDRYGNLSLQNVSLKTTQLSISEIVQRFKIFTTNQYIQNVKQNNWPAFKNQLWQRSFYDHVIGIEESLEKIEEYVLNNPLKCLPAGNFSQAVAKIC